MLWSGLVCIRAHPGWVSGDRHTLLIASSPVRGEREDASSQNQEEGNEHIYSYISASSAVLWLEIHLLFTCWCVVIVEVLYEACDVTEDDC